MQKIRRPCGTTIFWAKHWCTYVTAIYAKDLVDPSHAIEVMVTVEVSHASEVPVEAGRDLGLGDATVKATTMLLFAKLDPG